MESEKQVRLGFEFETWNGVLFHPVKLEQKAVSSPPGERPLKRQKYADVLPG
jgi:hypothetical protein